MGPHTGAQPAHFGQSSGHQRRAGVVPQAKAIGDAGSQGYDILQSPAQFHTYHICTGVGPEKASRKKPLYFLRHFLGSGGHGDCRGHLLNHFAGKARA